MRRRKGGNRIQDLEIIQLVLQGETDQYEILIHKYQKLVYFSILKIIDGEKVEAEDLTQEVFIAAYRSIHHFRHDSSFSTWLLKIAANRALDYKKKRKWATVKDEHILENIAANDDILSTMIRKESNHKLNQLIHKLPILYQNVILDFYYNQLSYQEISAKEEIEVKTVEVRLYRARKMLKTMWKEEQNHGV